MRVKTEVFKSAPKLNLGVTKWQAYMSDCIKLSSNLRRDKVKFIIRARELKEDKQNYRKGDPYEYCVYRANDFKQNSEGRIK